MFLKKKNYFLYFCNFMIMLGVFLGLNSMTWLMMWMSMEITLMFFIPRLILNKSLSESFSSLKYFIFQCLGSVFFILGSLDFFFFFNTFGLFIKLGLFPIHFWMFLVSKSLNWMNFFFFLTIQKLLPLMFLTFSMKYIFFLFLVLIFLNSIIGNLGSLNQMDLRFLMIFSSMNHMTWMIMSSNFNLLFFYFYIFFYFLLMYYIYLYFNKLNIFYMFQIFFLKNFNLNINLFFISLIFFSLLGFPPLMGFFFKLITLFSLINFMFLIFMFLMLMQNLIISYSYLRLIIFLYMNLSRSMKLNKMNLKTYLVFFFILFSIII